MEYSKKPIAFESMIVYQYQSIVSKEIIKKDTGTVTLFAFDKDQGLSEHTAPFDAMVTVLDGEAEISIDGNPVQVKAGEIHKYYRIRFFLLDFLQD